MKVPLLLQSLLSTLSAHQGVTQAFPPKADGRVDTSLEAIRNLGFPMGFSIRQNRSAKYFKMRRKNKARRAKKIHKKAVEHNQTSAAKPRMGWLPYITRT